MKTIRKSGRHDILRVTLRANGLRVTPQREVIYDELARSGDHPSAEQLHAEVRRRLPNVSLDTVNRTLMTFSRIGLADVVVGHGGPRRYDPEMSTHHHIHCVICGGIHDFCNSEFDALEIPADIRRRFKVLSKRVVVSGICPQCSRLRNRGK